MSRFSAFFRLLYICRDLLSEALTFIPLMACSQASLAAEILFLRKQLAFYQERKVKPRRFDDAAVVDGALFKVLRLEKCFDQCNAGYLHRLAQEGISALLALEVARRKAATTEKYPAIDR